MASSKDAPTFTVSRQNDANLSQQDRGFRYLKRIAFGSVILALAMWRFGGTVADPDLWGHVRFGIDKINAGSYLSQDVYSYLTAGRTWFNHEWLGEVVMGATFLQFGPAGLVVLKAVLAATLVMLLSWWLLCLDIPPVRVAIVMTLGILLLTPTLGTMRPQIFTTLLFAVTLILIDRSNKGASRVVWLLPLIFAVWVNLHGGVLSGIVVVWVWAVMCVALRRPRSWEVLTVAVVSSGALLLNPNGAAHVRFLLETATVPRPEIVEWGSVDLLGPLGIAYLALVALIGLALFRSRHQLDMPLVVPLLGLTIAPIVATRHLQLFVPAVIILGGPYLARLLVSEEGSRSMPKPSKLSAATAALVLVVAGSFSFVRVASASSCLSMESDQFAFPTRAIRALEAVGISGNAVVTFNWGEYVIWHLGPDLQVSIDGRRETIYGDDVLRANLDFADGTGDWSRLLSMAPVDLVIQATGTPGALLMRSEDGWRPVYEDPLTSVFAPSSSMVTLDIDEAVPLNGDGLCFPAGALHE